MEESLRDERRRFVIPTQKRDLAIAFSAPTDGGSVACSCESLAVYAARDNKNESLTTPFSFLFVGG
jgi:hypothetical protein